MIMAVAAVAVLGFAAIGSDSSDAAPQTVTMTIDDANGTGSVQYLNSGTWTDFGASQSFESGTAVTIKAISTSDDKFIWWTGDVAAVGEEYTFTVGSSPMAITAKFVDAAATYWTELLATTSGNGSGAIQFRVPGTTVADPFVDIPTGGIAYPVDAEITLKARAISGIFIWWTGDLSGTINEQTWHMNSTDFVHGLVGAEFFEGTTYTFKAYTVTGSDPPGESVFQYWQNDAYQDFPWSEDNTITVPEGTVLDLRLNIISGILVETWKGNDPALTNNNIINTTTVMFNTEMHARVDYNDASHLRVFVENHGSCSGAVMMSIDGSSGSLWNSGWNTGLGITLAIARTYSLFPATSGSTGTFVWWTGSLSGADPILPVPVGSDYTITAVFAENTYDITATIEDIKGLGGNGKLQYKYAGVWSDFPSSGVLKVPSDIGSIDVRAVADTGSVFLWWKGDISGPTNIQTLTVDGDKNVTAVFNRNSPGDNRNVVINVVGSGTVEVENDTIWGAGNWQAFPAGGSMVIPNLMSMEFRALPDTSVLDNRFIWWTGALRGIEATQALVIDSNKTMTATFSNNNQLVNFVAEGPGKIQYLLDGIYEDAPASMYVPMSLGSLSLRAVPSPTGANEFIWWTGDVTGTSPTASLALSGSAKTVRALFSDSVYTVTATTSEGTMEYILDGKNFAFPGAGLKVPNGFAGLQLRVVGAVPTNWNLNGTPLDSAANPLSITVTGNQAYTALFVVPAHWITVVAGPNGTVTPGSGDVDEGTDATYVLAPDSGYKVSEVLLDGVSVPFSGSKYVIKNVTAPHRLEVKFEESPTKKYYITASVDSGGSISPSGVVSVDAKSSITFNFSANPGKEIKSVLIDGKARNDLIGKTSYTFGNVLMNHSIEVLTGDKVITLTVEFVGGEGTADYKVGNGSPVRYSGNTTVIPYGSNITVNVTPSKGYEFKYWINENYGSVVGDDKSLDVPGVTDSVRLVAVFGESDSSDFPILWVIAILALFGIAVLLVAYLLISSAKAKRS